MNEFEEAFRKMTASPADRPGKSSDVAARFLHRWFCLAATAFAHPAYASMFQGETLDSVADGIAWVVLVVAPIVLIVGFWLIHILPEKIAEKRKHPQAKAIQTLCLLSLFFGGMLWPIAWLWAYSKPVLYKMAYGTDVDEHGAEGHPEKQPETADLSDAERMRMKVVDRQGAAPLEHHTRERA
jgi:CBS domain containing-hemolysin-like protein